MKSSLEELWESQLRTYSIFPFDAIESNLLSRTTSLRIMKNLKVLILILSLEFSVFLLAQLFQLRIVDLNIILCQLAFALLPLTYNFLAKNS